MSIQELYREIIIDHGKSPRNFGVLTCLTHQHSGFNPLCGDKLELYLYVKNNVIEDVKFNGSGCAISQASASLMTECIKKKSLPECESLFRAFHELVMAGKTEHDDILGKLSSLSGVAEYPMRVKCATLAWHTLQAALKHDEEITNTELDNFP